MSKEDRLIPYRLASLIAEELAEQYLETGSPVPWPDHAAEIPAFVDSIATLAVEQIGMKMAVDAGGPIAVPNWFVDELHRGFRARFTQLVKESLAP